MVTWGFHWLPEGLQNLVTLNFQFLGFNDADPVRAIAVDVGTFQTASLDPMVQLECPKVSSLGI